eukprot:272014-Chlamydomonas_euryale.AAC.1
MLSTHNGAPMGHCGKGTVGGPQTRARQRRGAAQDVHTRPGVQWCAPSPLAGLVNDSHGGPSLMPSLARALTVVLPVQEP